MEPFPGLSRFKYMEQIKSKRLRRSNRERMLGGVCGGIAEYFNVDPTIVRIIYIAVSILSVAFPGILAYLILWAVMPRSDVY